MSPRFGKLADFGQRLRQPTLLEWLVVAAIVAVLVALLVEETRWAASGAIPFPIRVLVFDAVQAIPIAHADVAVFRSAPLPNSDALDRDYNNFDVDRVQLLRNVSRTTTGLDGTAVVEFEIRTSSSNRRPTPHAHPHWVWVEVHAAGYGTVVVPVRHDSIPTAKLRELPELFVPIGLKPLPQ